MSSPRFASFKRAKRALLMAFAGNCGSKGHPVVRKRMRGRFWADVFYPGLAEVSENLYPLGARQGQPSCGTTPEKEPPGGLYFAGGYTFGF